MTTLTTESSPELSGPNWFQLAAKWGVPSLIALGSFWWLTQDASANSKAQTAAIQVLAAQQQETKEAIAQHVAHSHTDLERIARGVEALCRITARPRGLEELCGR